MVQSTHNSGLTVHLATICHTHKAPPLPYVLRDSVNTQL